MAQRANAAALAVDWALAEQVVNASKGVAIPVAQPAAGLEPFLASCAAGREPHSRRRELGWQRSARADPCGAVRRDAGGRQRGALGDRARPAGQSVPRSLARAAGSRGRLRRRAGSSSAMCPTCPRPARLCVSIAPGARPWCCARAAATCRLSAMPAAIAARVSSKATATPALRSASTGTCAARTTAGPMTTPGRWSASRQAQRFDAGFDPATACVAARSRRAVARTGVRGDRHAARVAGRSARRGRAGVAGTCRTAPRDRTAHDGVCGRLEAGGGTPARRRSSRRGAARAEAARVRCSRVRADCRRGDRCPGRPGQRRPPASPGRRGPTVACCRIGRWHACRDPFHLSLAQHVAAARARWARGAAGPAAGWRHLHVP